jgi:DNA-binding transcriptional MerR regulator
LQKLSGVKAHTIRIWEQRYNIIEPKRTASNIRYYTEQDLKFLMNIAFLNRKGIRISKIAKMTPAQIAEEVEKRSETEAESSDYFQAMAVAMLELDERKLCSLLEQSISELGVENVVLEILTPFMERTSMLWLSGSISTIHKRFAGCIIRRKILAAIDKLPIQSDEDAKTVILYTPEADQQELYLIFVEYLLKIRNIKVIYLGRRISIEEVKFAITLHPTDYVYTIISEKHKMYVSKDYLDRLCESLEPTKLLISGARLQQADIDKANITVIGDLKDLVTIFE